MSESAHSGSIKAKAVEAVVCIPTFRRPDQLEKTLASLEAQDKSEDFFIVVVENDAERKEGKAVADSFLSSGRLRGFCVVEERPGNCRAINRAFEAALEFYREAKFFLMIDDDETAAPTWVGEMTRAARVSKADIVGGPVLRAFETPIEQSHRMHIVFNSGICESGFVPALHGSGNCLIGRRVLEMIGAPFFDVKFNFLGGGDMDFFVRCRLKGFKTYWNDNAVVAETVPAARAKTSWIIRRSLAIGVINYTIDRKRYSGWSGAFLMTAKNILTLPLSFVRAVLLIRKAKHWLPASHPVFVAVGRNMAALGFWPTPYRLTTQG